MKMTMRMLFEQKHAVSLRMVHDLKPARHLLSERCRLMIYAFWFVKEL